MRPRAHSKRARRSSVAATARLLHVSDDEGVTATLKRPDGQTETVRTAWLADGRGCVSGLSGPDSTDGKKRVEVERRFDVAARGYVCQLQFAVPVGTGHPLSSGFAESAVIARSAQWWYE